MVIICGRNYQETGLISLDNAEVDMRNITLVLIGLGLLGMTGCATTDIFSGGSGDVMRPGAARITVTSEPPDAAIYLNDEFVGRTPLANLSFSYQFMAWKQPYGMGYTNPKMAGSFVIKVSKEGYKDVIKTIQFNCPSTTCTASCFPNKTDYHFVLEPNLQAVQDGFSGGISKADEIERYKQLLDKGIITKEEFEQKKKQLLGI